ncbi:MAG: hypothetical protein RLZZ158_1557, partial [Cyanobacteriota bacterium]
MVKTQSWLLVILILMVVLLDQEDLLFELVFSSPFAEVKEDIQSNML